jgi:hypothetical protein
MRLQSRQKIGAMRRDRQLLIVLERQRRRRTSRELKIDLAARKTP